MPQPGDSARGEGEGGADCSKCPRRLPVLGGHAFPRVSYGQLRAQRAPGAVWGPRPFLLCFSLHLS